MRVVTKLTGKTKKINALWFSKQTTFTLMYFVLFSESLIENWYNPNKLLSLNKDFYLFIYLFTRQKRLVGVL